MSSSLSKSESLDMNLIGVEARSDVVVKFMLLKRMRNRETTSKEPTSLFQRILCCPGDTGFIPIQWFVLIGQMDIKVSAGFTVLATLLCRSTWARGYQLSYGIKPSLSAYTLSPSSLSRMEYAPSLNLTFITCGS
jgi:hypothetical protein